MKHTKRFAALIICVLLLAMCVLPASGTSLNGHARAILIFSTSTVTVGENVSVTVKYLSDVPMGSWHYELNYDATKLEYVSGADSGGSGTLSFVNSLDTGKTTITQTVTFRAINAGDSAIRVNTHEIIADNGSFSKMTFEDASATMHVKASPSVSGNCDLSALRVSPGTLTPAFSSFITDYTMTVSNSVTSVSVSADTSDTAASYAVSGTELSVGANTVTVTVTAGNGVQKFYKVIVTRLEAPAVTAATPVTPANTTKANSTSSAATTVAGSTTDVSTSESTTGDSSTTTKKPTVSSTNKETTESYAALKQRADKAENNLNKARILLLAVAAAFVLFTVVVIIVIVIPRRRAVRRYYDSDADDYADEDTDGDTDENADN